MLTPKPIRKSHYILVALFGLPLIYIPNNPDLTLALRFGAIIGLAFLFCVFGFGSYLKPNFLDMHKFARLILGFVLISMLASTIIYIDPWQTRIIGRELEYQGLLFWLSCGIIGIGLRKTIAEFLKTKLAVVVTALVCAVSVVICYQQIGDNARLTGLLMQSTTMGFYGALTFAIAVWNIVNTKTKLLLTKQTILPFLALLASFAVVLLSQSRGSFYSCAITLVIYTIWASKSSTNKALGIAIATIVVATIPLIGGQVFARFIKDNVVESTNYRLTIYQKTFSDTLSGLYVIGYGPGAIPKTINSQDEVPKDIADTLGKGYIFLSSHDIILDFSYYFGLIAGAVLLGAWVVKGMSLVSRFSDYTLSLACFLAVGANAFINVPSLELTSLFFVLLFMQVPTKLWTTFYTIAYESLTKIHKRH